ncbi:hypothetical protein MH144_09695 [Paenibacillus sp. ACRRY]|nr:hypothetical protein [Paenibacillus sp. ACRRY]
MASSCPPVLCYCHEEVMGDASMTSFFVVLTEADMNDAIQTFLNYKKQLKDEKQEGKITIYEYRT